MIDFKDIAAPADLSDSPPLDQDPGQAQTPEQQQWAQDGVVIKRGFIPGLLIDRYCAVRKELNKPGGWPHATPYMEVAEIRDLCLYPPLMALLRHLIGDEMGMHLNLTGWVSTERNWHQDDYLNPPHVNSWYAAVWFALDTISDDSGPFEYVPGSHRWDVMRRELIWKYLSDDEIENPNWPKLAERFTDVACLMEIEERAVPVRQFLAERGDILIWHGRLMHRGSPPRTPAKERRAIITHYSARSRRPDMPTRAEHSNGGLYFVL